MPGLLGIGLNFVLSFESWSIRQLGLGPFAFDDLILVRGGVQCRLLLILHLIVQWKPFLIQRSIRILVADHSQIVFCIFRRCWFPGVDIVQIGKVGGIVDVCLLWAVVTHRNFLIVALKLLFDWLLIELHLLVIVAWCTSVGLLQNSGSLDQSFVDGVTWARSDGVLRIYLDKVIITVFVGGNIMGDEWAFSYAMSCLCGGNTDLVSDIL